MFSLAKYWSHLRLVDEIYLKNILQNIVQSWPCLLFFVVFKVVWWWDIWWTWKESGRAPTDSVVTYRVPPPSIVEFVLLFHAELMAPSTRSCVSGKKSPLLLKTKRLPDSCDETARRRSKGATIDAPKKGSKRYLNVLWTSLTRPGFWRYFTTF